MTTKYDNTLIIIPMYNEELNIKKVVADVKQVAPDARIVAVDDGSTDNCATEAFKEGALVISHAFNLGYGAALQTGYKYALKNGYDCVVQLDGDGQHDASYIPDLLKVLKSNEADVIIGSRFIGKNVYKIAFMRKLGMRMFSSIASILMKQPITDSTSGYQALNMDVLRFYVNERYPADFPDADTLIMLKRSGFRIKEVPVQMYGSAISMHSGIKPVYYIFKMVLSIILTMIRREGFTELSHKK